MKNALWICIFLLGLYAHGQSESKNFRTKSFIVQQDSIQIDSISINPFHFKVIDSNKKTVGTTEYTIDYGKSLLIIDSKKYPKIIVEYYAYPDFLTKVYSKFDKKIIVENPTNNSTLYKISSPKKNSNFKPFDGLNTVGSISRGLTIGNNQDAVLNSTLDLQIAGKLSDKVTLRASITDTNIPFQENGYTQQLNEFDRVFLELYSDKWSLKAGDVDLKDSNSHYGNFTKQVAGMSIEGVLEHSHNAKTKIFTSGALVKGKFANYQFIGQENNQGAYRILGPNSEQYIIILSGSETVYVNGLALTRGDNNDYVIDYNTAEITFTPTFPITSNMRISVDFQYSDRNYTRFISHNGAQYESEKLTIGGSFYIENDVKNQSLQQDLSDQQKQLLSLAGNDITKMVSPSAVLDSYSESKIQYRKDLIGINEIYVFSNDQNDELYNVLFTNVGENQGDYILSNTIAIGKIYKYIGENLGNYNPTIQLVAPNKLQLAIVNASYNPSEKTSVNAEIAFSQNDQNLFSTINNDINDGLASKIEWNQTLIDKKWNLKSSVNFETVTADFKTIQRFRNIEFNRDWNIINPSGDQQLFNTSFLYSNQKNDAITYNYEQLNYGDAFDGNRHSISVNLNYGNLKIDALSSLLNSESLSEKNNFKRLQALSTYHFNKSWIGLKVNAEDNNIKNNSSQILSPLSQKFNEYEPFIGIGDSTKIFVEVGANFRVNDSVKSNTLQQVNKSKTYYINSQLIKNKNSNLSFYANYRTVENLDHDNTKSLNSRVVYNQSLFNKLINLGSVYETLSGSLPQQEFSYIEVEAGQGFYTWNDYNENGIQELNEFEIAQFQDKATYLRVALPTLNYIETHQTKFSQSLLINFQQWNNKKGVNKFLSHFQNQSYLLLDTKQSRSDDSFNLNPLDINNDDVIALNYNLKNSLFFNRGKQLYSATYTYIDSRNKTSFSIDNLESKIKLHQLLFTHKISDYWLIDISTSQGKNSNSSQNFISRNYNLQNTSFNPKISYLYNDLSSLNISYEFKTKENKIGDLESLISHKMGASYRTSNKKNFSLQSEFNFFINDFIGNQNSPVAYQILEGLQNGNNFTWSILWQQKLTNYLDLNLNYLGRKSETSNTVHNGTVQLRANF